MPKTTFQGVVFTALMVFCMVFCMTAYTIALKFGGLTYQVFAIAVQEMWLEYAIVFCLAFFVMTKLARKLTFRIFDPAKTQSVFIMLGMQSFTVCLMVPTITLIATFIHNGFTADWFTQWIQSAVLCFPMAYFLQIFFVGPFVRVIFRTLFRSAPAK